MTESDKAQAESLPRVTENSQLGIAFVLTLAGDGEVVEATEDNEVFRFQIGDGQLFSALENWLIGLELGTRVQLGLSPAQAFGEPDPSNVHRMDRRDFPEEMVLEPGYVVGLNTPTGEEVPATVLALEADSVLLDFNHPLAGKPLNFDATIKEIDGQTQPD
ncbi:MAG: FKBP-type peptidyl-prolyl cis-trans isomerase [Hydrogenovibrio sp.]|uniref:FKBP-type peptidyl-prolyl cis-trans isomerase n=1 Tax=Hydrogenovibrio sp. TaxID=2065821 RepID=UPI002870980B|nr:FKBP-type peptidyl-prolyl cis-trans isomerase [Hydrogenovibrio sp.]MDR9497834.1 FKBP-type peptidyl-prolyl cis-trans isomerase [Hydrogenovibrio sp.]